MDLYRLCSTSSDRTHYKLLIPILKELRLKIALKSPKYKVSRWTIIWALQKKCTYKDNVLLPDVEPVPNLEQFRGNMTKTINVPNIGRYHFIEAVSYCALRQIIWTVLSVFNRQTENFMLFLVTYTLWVLRQIFWAVTNGMINRIYIPSIRRWRL